MVRAAKAQGLSLTGPDGLLKQLTKMVLEVSLEEEMDSHQVLTAYVTPLLAPDGLPTVRRSGGLERHLDQAPPACRQAPPSHAPEITLVLSSPHRRHSE